MIRRQFTLITSLLLLLIACDSQTTERERSFFRSWNEISKSDTLRVGTMTSPQDFYLYRGEMMGAEYQKVSEFAQENNLSLDIRIAKSVDTLLAWVASGEVDLSITRIPMTKANTEAYDFAGMVDTSSLVLVQRKRAKIETLAEMGGKTVWAEYGSAAALRLRQIAEEIGQDIDMIIPDTLGIEDILVKMTESDSIQYAIAGKELGSIITKYYPALDASLRVSAPIRYSWAIAKGNHTLKECLNRFTLDPVRHKHYMELQRQNTHLHKFINSEVNEPVRVKLEKGAISIFDSLFMKEAKRLPWSWTLLAAIAYQESNFRSGVIGWSGARGLMGIMPRTGRAYGVSIEQLLHPDVSIRVAVDCLLDTSIAFANIKNPHERLCFTLAGYNAGVGHVQDAMRLARKHHAPDDKWYGGVREYILLKSNPEYYNDNVVKNGYLRGKETTNYVDRILERQSAYDALLKKK